MKLRKALISAGGFGTRMKALTRHTPKPMLPLQGKPILEYSIEMCREHGIRDIAISVLYLSEVIKDHFGDGRDFGVKITYIEEPEPLGTAGALNLRPEWFDEPFFMCNADELKDIDLHRMSRQHAATGALATMALTRVNNPSNYGVVEMEGDQILRFVEKPDPEEAPSDLINAGLYLLEPEVVKYVPQGHSMIEKDVFPVLAQERRLFGHLMEGQWFDTGTPERYETAERLWKGFSYEDLHLTYREGGVPRRGYANG